MADEDGHPGPQSRAAGRRYLAIIGPGLLVAATGVGAGDLATAGLAGSILGVTVLWAAVLGAALKFVLNEGIARWQLVTGRTLLEGCIAHLGWPFRVCFLIYLLPWTFFVCSALMGACGVTANAILPVFDDPSRGKLVLGVVHSGLGVLLVRVGGYRLFERLMAACICVMFVTVVATAILIRPDVGPMLAGLAVPNILSLDGQGLAWTVALMGGVGGTLTILCYGYWIREAGRAGPKDIRTCRVDLATGYAMTVLFAIAMVVIGSEIRVDAKGVRLIVVLADRLAEPLGPVGRWAFLLGAWGAVFSSLFGVWQSVPYIFADFVSMSLGESPTARNARVSTVSRTYRLYLYALATVPITGLLVSFKEMQKYYAVLGACFIPLLACVLLYLNGRKRWVGPHVNRPATVLVLVLAVAFFVLAGWLEVRSRFAG
jgi:Mn2+/Fe2+ NRAMP family transporter